MTTTPVCSQCGNENTYRDRDNFVCIDCGHEWLIQQAAEINDEKVIKDFNGNILADGDAVCLLKTLRLKVHLLPLKWVRKLRVSGWSMVTMKWIVKLTWANSC